MNLPSSTATSSDVQNSPVQIECYLDDYTSITASVDFNIAVHEITASFTDMHVLINGSTLSTSLGSWVLNPGDSNYDDTDFAVSFTYDTSLTQTVTSSGYSLTNAVDATESDATNSPHKITITIEPTT